MQVRERDEEKRTRDWRIVLLVSTILIILIGGFFAIKAMVGNPLEGKWLSKDQGYYLEIDDGYDADVKVTIQEIPVEVDLYYTMDKEAKTITFESNPQAYGDAVEDTNHKLSAGDIEAYLTGFLTAFDYSLEQDTLTLTERESGEQFIFTRVK